MDREQFQEKYPSLSPVLGVHFYDSDTGDDDINARETRADLPPDKRALLLERVLTDAHRLITNIDSEWEILVNRANRQLNTRDQAREWLMRVMVTWQEELARLRNGGSKSA